MGLPFYSILPYLRVPKKPVHSKTHQYQPKSPKLVPATKKPVKKTCEKNQRNAAKA